jgi:hypothetical protein
MPLLPLELVAQHPGPLLEDGVAYRQPDASPRRHFQKLKRLAADQSGEIT